MLLPDALPRAGERGGGLAFQPSQRELSDAGPRKRHVEIATVGRSFATHPICPSWRFDAAVFAARRAVLFGPPANAQKMQANSGACIGTELATPTDMSAVTIPLPETDPVAAPPQRAAVPDTAAPVVHPLRGHSGARLVLHGGRGSSIVRKTAGSAAQNARLLAQSKKLRSLARCGVRVPRVLAEGHDEAGFAFYEMEYVPARTLATVMREAVSRDSAVLPDLRRMLAFFAMTAGKDLPAAAFQDKIGQIVAATSSNAHHGAAIAAMGARLSTLDWSGIPASPSHGDLTLENILLAGDGRIVFIDCDDGWLSSWWIDAAKLHQDVQGHWCLRDLYSTDEAAGALLRATQRLERFRASLDILLASLDVRLMDRLPQLTALHLFRTLPYVQDEGLTGFVLARMAAVLSQSDPRHLP